MPTSERRFKVLLIGRHDLACRILDLLRQRREVELACVVARREDAQTRPSLRWHAAANAVPILDSGEAAAVQGALQAYRPDLLVSAGYDLILTAEALAQSPRAINLHFGMLPRYRGSFSIPWAILNNEPEIGVTLHDMAPSIDDGAVIRQERIINKPALSCRDLYLDAVAIGANLVDWFVARAASGDPPPGTPQDERKATYYNPDYPGAFRIPWKQTVTYAGNYIRAAHFPPYDGAFSEIDERRVLFEWPVERRFEAAGAKPGTVVECDGKFGIATLNGVIMPGNVVLGTRADFSDLAREASWLHRTFR